MVRNILKHLSKGWLVMMMVLNMAPLVHAQQISCQGLNDPEATKDLIISIVEEQFGEPQSQEGSQVLRCVRKTTCKEESVKKEGSTQEETQNICRSEYVDPSGCSPSGGDICQTVDVYVAQSGLDLLTSYLGAIYRWAAGVIGVVSVFYLVYGGIKISTAGDNTAAIDEAKTKIIQSIAGLVLLFLSAIILYTINPNFFTF